MATVLVVDDRAANRELLSTLLGYKGHRVLEAGSGESGLEMARAHAVDLVITDILMPAMDGYEFVRLLRATPGYAEVPVIFFTAYYHEDEAKGLAEACGVSAVMTKPSEPQDILDTIARALGEGPPSIEPVSPEAFDREHLRVLTDKLHDQAQDLRRINSRLDALVDLSLQLGSERDPKVLLEEVAKGARDILACRYAMVATLLNGRSELRYFSTAGMSRELSDLVRPSAPTKGLFEPVVRDAASIRASGDEIPTELSAAFPSVNSLLCVPVVSPNRIYGWLLLIDKLGADSFSDEDERLATILAAQVGRIYENGSLYSDLLIRTAELEEEIQERRIAEGERDRIFTQSPNLLCIGGFDGSFKRLNPEWEALLGWPLEELLVKQYLDVVHPEDRQETMGAIQRLRTGETITSFENRCLTRDGEFRWVLWNGTPFLDKDSFYATGRDITGRKRLEQDLLAAQRRLTSVSQSSPAVLYILEVRGAEIEQVWISENVRQMLGYEPEATMAAVWWTENVHPEDTHRVEADFRRAATQRKTLLNEFRFRSRSGEYRWIRNEARFVPVAGTQEVQVLGSWSDVTERRRLEDQFHQSQKMEAVGQLAGGIAHDFNNMLAVIIGYSDLLELRSELAPEVQAQIRLIGEAAQRAAGLTRQLLTFSRKQIAAPKRVDVNQLIPETHGILKRLLGEDIQLATALCDEPTTVLFDPGQFGQILLNLAVNSRDAMPSGGKLTIESRRVVHEEGTGFAGDLPPGPYVLIAVSDNGEGIEPENLDRVFEPFFTTKEIGKGTGLGLATVYGIVRQHEGHVTIYSEVGVGTTIRIYLPLAEGETHPTNNAPAPAMPGGSETILLVEDEQAVAAMARMLLEVCGYTVLVANEPSAALAIAAEKTQPIDLMVTDVVMPQMSGRELAERIKAMRPETRILFMSGYTEDAVIRHGVLAATVAYIEKPLNARAFAQKIRDLLDAGTKPDSRTG